MSIYKLKFRSSLQLKNSGEVITFKKMYGGFEPQSKTIICFFLNGVFYGVIFFDEFF